MKNDAIYCLESTGDRNCRRQVRDLEAFAVKAGFNVAATFVSLASGKDDDRKERAEVMKLAQAGKIDAILVTETTRWVRSTSDLLTTLEALESYGVSVVTQAGFQFDLTSPQGQLLAGILSSLSHFERELIAERAKAGLAAARAKGKVLGRPVGSRSIAKHRDAVKRFLSEGRSYR